MNQRVTTLTVKQLKQQKTPIAMLTAYDYSMAKLLDEAGIDMLLVGDSLGNVVLGYDTTLPVTMDEMLHHAKAVGRAAKRALVVVDMPFMSYHISVGDAVSNAGRFLKEASVQAVKIEGGSEVVPVITKLVQAGIPVVGHLGLTPQSVHQLGGYKVQGKNQQAAQKLLDDAKIVEASGAFALVLECVPALLAKKITEELTIPTIGIGAGSCCDGQVLVINDLLGMTTTTVPKFVKKYVDLHEQIVTAATAYKQEVVERSFPATEHGFAIDDDIIEKLY